MILLSTHFPNWRHHLKTFLIDILRLGAALAVAAMLIMVFLLVLAAMAGL